MAKSTKSTKTRKASSGGKAAKARKGAAVKPSASKAAKARKSAKAPAKKASAPKARAQKTAAAKKSSRPAKTGPAKLVAAAKRKMPTMSKAQTKAAAITAGAIAATAAIATAVVKSGLSQKLTEAVGNAARARREQNDAAPTTSAIESAEKDEPPGAAAQARRSGAGRAGSAGGAERKLPAWMADHLERYLATNGADGHIWRGMPTLLLTTIGRNTGERRVLPLLYGTDGDRYLVVGSKGGAPDHPAWYKNLVANPQVEVQVKGDRFRARARTANRDERPRLWRTVTKLFPLYEQYQARTAREIPVIVIERTA